jgi:hypothetical protein
MNQRAKRTLRRGRTTPPRGMTSGNSASRWRGGTRVAGVGSSVGGRAPRPRRHRAGTPGLRSLPAKQHAPKARPLPATDRGRQGVVPGRRSRANGLAVGACAVAGCRTFTLDCRPARPASTTDLRRSWWPVRRGEGPPPGPPPAGGAARRDEAAMCCQVSSGRWDKLRTIACEQDPGRVRPSLGSMPGRAARTYQTAVVAGCSVSRCLPG